MANKVADFGIRTGIKLLRTNPDKALPMLLKGFDAISHGEMPSQRKVFHDVIDDPNSNGYHMIKKALEDFDPGVIETFVSNFLLNASMTGWQRQQECREKYGCNIPWAILLDPTSACNLHCKGCWAADYGNRMNLSFEDIDSIITQGKELGVYMYIYTGGEPLVRKKDIIRLCEKHSDCVFLCFTNGTLIDEEFCEDLLRVKNFMPAISIEGNEETTDARRGDGVYESVQRAMKLLRDHRRPVGTSCCYTRQNMERISDDAFMDMLVKNGAMFAWYFHYFPVGSDADLELLPTPEQRKEMYKRIRYYRHHKDLFVMDFQNDGEYVQGCIAGGRRYFHINANGDCDPCVFIHFSDRNIHDYSLLDCLRGPLFMAYHDGQPFNENMLKPCPLLENPGKLTEMVNKTGAKSTNLEADETAEELQARAEKYAADWSDTADDIWKKHPHKMIFTR